MYNAARLLSFFCQRCFHADSRDFTGRQVRDYSINTGRSAFYVLDENLQQPQNKKSTTKLYA